MSVLESTMAYAALAAWSAATIFTIGLWAWLSVPAAWRRRLTDPHVGVHHQDTIAACARRDVPPGATCRSLGRTRSAAAPRSGGPAPLARSRRAEPAT